MRNYLVIFILMLSAPLQAKEKSDAEFIVELMVVAKATGMCGVFSQMANFQETTKMSGGDEFIVRFLKTEAARLGHTLESLMKTCPPVVKKYNDTMKIFNGK